MSAGCVIDNQMWSGHMCPHVMVSALEVVTLVNIISDTEACQTKRDPARCHHMSPDTRICHRHPIMSQGMASPQMFHRCCRICEMPRYVDRRAQMLPDVPGPLQTPPGVRGQMLQMSARQHAPFSECEWILSHLISPRWLGKM